MQFVSATKFESVDPVSSISVPFPTGASVGDLVIMQFFSFNLSSEPVYNADWSVLSKPAAVGTDKDIQSFNNDNAYSAYLFYRLVDGTEDTNYTFTMTFGSTIQSSVILSYLYTPVTFTFTALERVNGNTNSISHIGSNEFRWGSNISPVAASISQNGLLLNLWYNSDTTNRTFSENARTGTMRGNAQCGTNSSNDVGNLGMYEMEVSQGDYVESLYAQTDASSGSYVGAAVLIYGDPIIPDPLTRIRSNISKQTTITDYGVRPVDGTFNEVFMPFVDLDVTQKYDFVEIMRWPDASLTRWPIPQNTASFESSYIGESQLARIATFDAPRVIEAVERMTFASIVTNRVFNADGNYEVSLRYVIDYFFSLCADLYPWFSAETCPAIYAADGLDVTVEALYIPQSENNKVTIDEFLKEILSCTGIEIIENKAGNLELVPRYGPDAYSDATIILKESDILSPLYEPKADPRDFYNAAEITQRPLTFEVGQEVVKPAYIVFAYDDNNDADFTPVPSGFTAIDTTDATADGIEHIGIGWFYVGREYQWPVLDADTLIGGTLLFLDIQAEIFKRFSSSGLISAGTYTSKYQTVTLTADAAEGATSLTVSALAEDIASGQPIEFSNDLLLATANASAGATSISVSALSEARITGDEGVTSLIYVNMSSNSSTTLTIPASSAFYMGHSFRFDPESQSIVMRIESANLFTDDFANPQTVYYFEYQMRGYGAKYTQSNISTTESFGLSDTDELSPPGEPEGALAASRALYGRKTLRVSLNYISMSLARLTAIAEALVRQYINPAKLWEFSLSPIGMQRGPDFDSIGQKIRLPNNKELVVEGITYSDAKTYQSLAVSMTVKARESFIIYDEESLDFGLGYYVDENGNYYVDENGDYYIDETYTAADGTPTPLPSPADPVASSFEGYGGEANNGDWTNASVTTVSTYADVKTQLAIAGTQATPRIVRLTANCTGSGAGGFGTDDLVMAVYVGLDLNGFSLLGGSSEPQDSDNVLSANWYPDGPLMDNHCRVFSSQSGGRLGHFYDGIRMRNGKTGMIIENVIHLFCMDEYIDYFADTAGAPTSKASLINPEFRTHSTDPFNNDSHPILVQSDSYNHNGTYLTIARGRFNANLANRVPFMKNGGFLHMYNCVQYNMLSADGHVNLSGGAKGLFENNVIYDSSTSGGQRFTFTNNTATAQFSGNFYMNNATQGLPNGTAFTPSYSYTLIADRIDIAAESGAH